MSWTNKEERFLKSLHTPTKIQKYLDSLIYNPDNSVASPRYVMMTGEGHCLEACLVAAAALELQGHIPYLVNLLAHKDHHHALTIYKSKNGWGSLSKSNTTLLGGRQPYYRNVRELVMSYFDFYFNVKGEYSLYAFSKPINLKKFNHWNWRTSEHDLIDLGVLFTKLPHNKILGLKELAKMPKAKKRVIDACLLGANPDGLI